MDRIPESSYGIARNLIKILPLFSGAVGLCRLLMSVNTGSNMTLFSVKKIVHLEDQVYDD
jgi:hypothetical protein